MNLSGLEFVRVPDGTYRAENQNLYYQLGRAGNGNWFCSVYEILDRDNLSQVIEEPSEEESLSHVVTEYGWCEEVVVEKVMASLAVATMEILLSKKGFSYQAFSLS